MDRRAFIGTVTGVWAAAPLAVLGQQTRRLPRVGILAPDRATTGPTVGVAFVDGLRSLGWVEGKNVLIVRRAADQHPERYPSLAADLVRQKVDVILCAGGPASLRAAKNATRSIPIVMVASSRDPVGDGLVKSLRQPGGNITGITSVPAEAGGKLLELLKEAVPGISRVGAILDATAGPLSPETAAAARLLGLEMVVIAVRKPSDFDGAIAHAAKARVGGLLVASTPLTARNAKQLADIITRHRLPAVALFRRQAEAGLLMTYGPSLTGEFRDAATYVDKILRGAHPGDLPVEQPAQYELVINLKTAKALGIAIPQSILIRSDKVIQ